MIRSATIGVLLALGLFAAAQVHAADSLRPEVGKPLQDAQAAIQAKKYREALTQVDAAGKIGSLTPYESYIVERMRAAAATGAGDMTTAIKAYEAALASPQMPEGDKQKTYEVIARLAYAGHQYDEASMYIGKYRSAGGDNAQTLALLPQALYLAGDLGAAQRELHAQLAQIEKAGQKPSQTQLELLASIAVKQSDSEAYRAALEKLVVYYPKPDYWQDLIARTASKPGFSDRLALDIYRVKKASGSLNKVSDFMEAAQLALQAGYPGEAQQYIELGYQKKLLGTGADAARHQRLKELVARKIAEDRATLADGDRQAAAQASGDALVSAGLNHVGYGDYAHGVALIEQGLEKGELKKPDEARLHLGYAQMLAGKKDAALKTLRSVQGKDGSAEVARLLALSA